MESSRIDDIQSRVRQIAERYLEQDRKGSVRSAGAIIHLASPTQTDMDESEASVAGSGVRDGVE